MSGFSTERADLILDAAFGGTAYSEAATNYLALTQTPVLPGDTGASILEAEYEGYERYEMEDTDWSASAEGAKHNIIVVKFAACTGGLATAVGWAYCTAKATATGLVICSGKIPTTEIKAGVQPEIAIGGCVYRLLGT
jgi:hypothetical protein